MHTFIISQAVDATPCFCKYIYRILTRCTTFCLHGSILCRSVQDASHFPPAQFDALSSNLILAHAMSVIYILGDRSKGPLCAKCIVWYYQKPSTHEASVRQRIPIAAVPSLLSYFHDESLDSFSSYSSHKPRNHTPAFTGFKAVMAMYGAPNVYPSSPIMAPPSPLMMSQQQPQPFSPSNGQQIQAGQITYTSSTAPDGRITYHPFKSVYLTSLWVCTCRADLCRTIVIMYLELSQRGMMACAGGRRRKLIPPM